MMTNENYRQQLFITMAQEIADIRQLLQNLEELLMTDEDVIMKHYKDLQQFGDDALVEVVTLNRSRPLDAGVSELLETIQAWCQPKGPLDDVSILGFEWRG